MIVIFLTFFRNLVLIFQNIYQPGAWDNLSAPIPPRFPTPAEKFGEVRATVKDNRVAFIENMN